jgi:Na+/proline symporter
MVDPLSKLPIHAPAICLMGFTAIHIISAGLHGVMLTGAIQCGFILIGSGILIVTAVGIVQWGGNLPDPEEGVAEKPAEA